MVVRTAALILALLVMSAIALAEGPGHFKTVRYTPDGNIELLLRSYGPPRAKTLTHDKRCRGATLHAPRRSRVY
jgi:hypothetical protein